MGSLLRPEPIVDGAPTEVSTAEIEAISRQVFLTLAQLLTEEALTILRHGAEDNGLDAWRRLSKR